MRLTKAMVSQSRVIAKGLRIRDVRRLVREYGGRISRWVKKSSPPVQAETATFEYHWYEHPGIGRVEVKRMRISDS